MTIRYAFADSPFGDMLLAATGAGVCYAAFTDEDRPRAREEFFAAYREHECDLDNALQLVARQFFRQETSAPLTADLSGKYFQISVWNALMEMPFGATTSYQALATRLGRPTAARAVARAVASNRIAWLVPCHRVIRSSGAPGGYRWGAERKVRLLDWERRTRGPGRSWDVAA